MDPQCKETLLFSFSSSNNLARCCSLLPLPLFLLLILLLFFFFLCRSPLMRPPCRGEGAYPVSIPFQGSMEWKREPSAAFFLFGGGLPRFHAWHSNAWWNENGNQAPPFVMAAYWQRGLGVKNSSFEKVKKTKPALKGPKPALNGGSGWAVPLNNTSIYWFTHKLLHIRTPLIDDEMQGCPGKSRPLHRSLKLRAMILLWQRKFVYSACSSLLG